MTDTISYHDRHVLYLMGLFIYFLTSFQILPLSNGRVEVPVNLEKLFSYEIIQNKSFELANVV